MPDAHDPAVRSVWTRTARVSQSARFPRRSQVVITARTAAAASPAGTLPGGEPRKARMVRRRSTVRFRKGAPQSSRSDGSSDHSEMAFKIT
jgi:hypothetical protein